MNIGVMLLHIDCPTRTTDYAAPPKMQTIGQDGQLYGTCPACGAWVVVDLTPIDVPPTTSLLVVPVAAEV